MKSIDQNFENYNFWDQNLLIFSFFDTKCPKIPFSDLLIVIRKWGFSDQITVLKFTEIYKFNGYRPKPEPELYTLKNSHRGGHVCFFLGTCILFDGDMYSFLTHYRGVHRPALADAQGNHIY